MEGAASKAPRTTPVKRADLNSLGREQLLEKLRQLEARERELCTEIADLRDQGASGDLKPEMQALHNYNDMKDMTQVVLGYLAAAENTTVADLHARFNLPSL